MSYPVSSVNGSSPGKPGRVFTMSPQSACIKRVNTIRSQEQDLIKYTAILISCIFGHDKLNIHIYALINCMDSTSHHM